MNKGVPHVVLGSNVIYSGLYSRRGASFQVLSLLGSGLFEISLSVPLVLEYEEVLLRRRDTLGLTQSDVADMLDYMCEMGRLHDIYFLWRPALGDPNDEMVLELAVSAECTHIVTYNQRNFADAQRFDVEVITPKTLLEWIGALQ